MSLWSWLWAVFQPPHSRCCSMALLLGFFIPRGGSDKGTLCPLSSLYYAWSTSPELWNKYANNLNSGITLDTRALILTTYALQMILSFSTMGEYRSINMILQGIELFAAKNYLWDNKNKSAYSCCGMEQQESQRVSGMSCFSQGTLPFKYLGIPSYAHKEAVCCRLWEVVDKMVVRIRVWSTRHISYDGRKQ